AAVESSRGETGIHLVTDGSETPYRMHYRGPSLFALQALEDIIPGHLLADAVVMIGSTDVMLGETDR
ncbi:NADH-quinone oxidoreductase subunit D, partial [bacterium]|nr:NADH-quinone oxidoreductase subunit D [bacterium]